MIKKLGLVYEGSDDKAFLTPLISRSLEMPESAIIPLAGAKSIKGIKQGLKSKLKDFSLQGCTHVLICTDNDRVTASEREQHLSKILQLNPVYDDWNAFGQLIEIDSRNPLNERVPSLKELLEKLEEWKVN